MTWSSGEKRPWRFGRLALLWALCLASFLTAASGVARSPFLLAIAADLESNLAAVANLMSFTALSWGAASLVAGIASDRLGRRPILVGGLLLLGGSALGFSLATSYLQAAIWALLGGFGGGAFMGTVFATVSDQVAPNERGRALGWIMTGQSLSLVLGVPLATLIGTLGGWRGAHLAQAIALLAIAGLVWLLMPVRSRRRPDRAETGLSVPLTKILGPRVLALLAAGTTERVCFASLAVYLATYLLTTYGVPLHELALALGLVAVGNLLGNLLGSQLADRVQARPLLFAASSVATGLLALPLLLWQPGLAISIGLGFACSLANALGRPALMATLSEAPSEARGTVLGLNMTFASFGWLGATALGGWLVTSYGFGSLGLFSAAVALLGAALASASWLAGGQRAVSYQLSAARGSVGH